MVRSTDAVAITSAVAAAGLYNVQTKPFIVRRLQRVDDRRDVKVIDVRRPTYIAMMMTVMTIGRQRRRRWTTVMCQLTN